MKEHTTFLIVIAVVLFIASICVGMFLYVRREQAKQEREAEEHLHTYLASIEAELKEKREMDTDGDGLSDEQEVFAHGTDPKNPDTDFDSFVDGDEVLRGFDPRVHADKGDRLVPLLNDASNEDNYSNKLVDLIKESLDTEGADEYSAEDVNRIVSSYLTGVNTVDAVPEVPPESLALSSDTSDAAIREYLGRSVASLDLTKKILGDNEGFESIVQRARRGDDEALDLLIAAANKAYAELMRMPVPNDPDVLVVHTTNMKLIVLLKTVFEELKMIDEDPVRAALSAKYAQDAQFLANENDARLKTLQERVGYVPPEPTP